MKVTLVVLGFACFVGALNALPIDEVEPDFLPNFDEEFANPSINIEELIPDNRLTTTQRTTRPPQFHHNNLRIQGPFAGRLINVVANQEGDQDTLQTNRIQYNIDGVRRTLEQN